MADSRLSAAASQPVFFYDLGSPECYLVAEQVGGLAEWEPVLASDISDRISAGKRSDIERAGTRLDIEHAGTRSDIERYAAELGLQPLRWPSDWPPDSRIAMLAATYAKGIGRAVAFSLAAFRQEFAAGRDVGDEVTLLIAGAACEIHPSALLKGISLRSVGEGLGQAGERARACGVRSLPALVVGTSIFEGLRPATDAALSLRAR